MLLKIPGWKSWKYKVSENTRGETWPDSNIPHMGTPEWLWFSWEYPVSSETQQWPFLQETNRSLSWWDKLTFLLTRLLTLYRRNKGKEELNLVFWDPGKNRKPGKGAYCLGRPHDLLGCCSLPPRMEKGQSNNRNKFRKTQLFSWLFLH